MTKQDKFECISNFEHTNNILSYNEEVQKTNNKMNIITYKNEKSPSPLYDEIKRDEFDNYKNLIKNHPLFPVLVLQYNLCDKAMYNVNNKGSISMEPMSNYHLYTL
uniref:Homeobox-containing protein n=1 Tax=Strongyloides stercoralis TaxID=6248 RepID=A0A0K0E4C4_STRER